MMQSTYFLARRAARAMGSFQTSMLRRAIALAIGAVWLTKAPLSAQSPQELESAGDRESVARRPSAALVQYEKVILSNARSYAALWKASREAVDLGEFERNAALRTSLYQRAADYARRAVAVNATDAEGHFHLARAVGRTALNSGPREKVRFAVEVRDEALKALQFNPNHAGALHVLGVWNAEVLRLNGIARVMAKTFMGGQALATANWADAIRYMERAVAVEPNRLVHQLDLARVYRDAERPADAKLAFEAAIRAPAQDANDDQYRKAAVDELKKLRML